MNINCSYGDEVYTSRGMIIQILLMMPFSMAIHTVRLWHLQPDYTREHFTCPLNTSYTICYTLSQLLHEFRQEQQHPDLTILRFQPGNHYLRYNSLPAVFVNLNTLEFRGEVRYGTTPTIRCLSSAGKSLEFQNITTISINNIDFEGCGDISRSSPYHSSQQPATLHFINCSHTTLNNITITPEANSSGMTVVNCQQSFKLTNYTIVMKHCNNRDDELTQYGILVNFTVNSFVSHVFFHLTAIQYHFNLHYTDCRNYITGIGQLQTHSIYITIIITQLNVDHVISPRVLYYYSSACKSSFNNHVNVADSMFNNNQQLESAMFDIKFEDCWLKEGYTPQQSIVSFSHCQIAENVWSVAHPVISITSTFSVFTKTQVFISNCNFTYNKNMLILKVKSENDLTWLYSNLISIQDTHITHITCTSKHPLISTQHTLLSLSQLTVNHVERAHSIFKLKNSVMQIRLLNKVTNNKAQYFVWLTPGSYICLMDNSHLAILNNTVISMLFFDGRKNKRYPCVMQFISTRRNLDGKNRSMIDELYHVTIKNNTEHKSMFFEEKIFDTSNCQVITGTAVNEHSYAALVNSFVIQNNTNKQKKNICNCKVDGGYSCEKDELLIATFPGKTVTAGFFIPNDSILNDNTGGINITLVVDESQSQSNCLVLNKSELIQRQPNDCSSSEFHYTLSSHDEICLLYLKEQMLGVTDSFKIKLAPCPLGFSKDNKNTCQCDEILIQYSLPITSCNINNEMITRQANSWISGEKRNEDQISNYVYIYKASLNCPFDYCKQQSSKLLLNNSDAQCQYNRTGLVCGHCPESLSTIFGSSKCQQCSNIYLLIIIPIAIAGIVLVLMMFILNLTIVNGLIATLILYVNIITINKTLLFPSSTNPLYILIAMANLDLGIESCFYNGMGDYAKMWLQLAFPFYLMFIAVSLILASRYCSMVQRVTAQRGLPVLATLFLLSYTKILSTTTVVLFLYSRVITLSRNTNSILEHREELVWAVSSDVKLFEAKHMTLFIVNALLLLILIPFSIILLFNRKLSRFKIIQRFKPILDPYKAPYKDRFCYWTGYQLIIRMAFLSAGSLSKHNNLTVAMLITGVAMCIHGYLHPFKHKLLNLQELMMLLNVLIIYVSTNFEQDYHHITIRVAVGVAIGYFTAVLCWHSVTQTCGKFMFKNLPQKVILWKERLSNSYELNEMPSHDNSWIVGTYEEYRDPLVAVTD